jgi:shikimate dehydrogenase
MNLNTQTILCGIMGHPVSHSLSPDLHNAGYVAHKLNFVYLAFDVNDAASAIMAIRALHIKGMSVTIPHKISVMQHLDQIDNRAKNIGAVNTIVNTNGRLVGFNTDCDGAMKALEEKTSIRGKKVVLLGTGGAARAIAFGLQEKKAQVLILGRNPHAAKALADATGATHGSLSQCTAIKASDILIHATSIGMEPHAQASIVPIDLLHKNLTVFDIVYKPKNTKLISDATKIGCTIVYGHSMLLYQAAAQFKLFTGLQPSIPILKKVLLKNLKG